MLCDTYSKMDATEFQQHPSVILECDSAKVSLLNHTILRLAMSEVAFLRLGSKFVVMEQHTCPKKVNPLLWHGSSFTDVCALQASRM